MLPALTVIAIFVGPIVAIQLQKMIERASEKRKAKLDIYKTLMATRGMGLHINHVQALNLIDITFRPKRFVFFASKKEQAVLLAWKTYMEYLYKYPKTSDKTSSDAIDRWSEKKTELFIDLMHKMSNALGFNFDKVQIERQSYTPQGYGNDEAFRLQVQEQILQLFNGEIAIPVQITNPPENPIEEQSGEQDKK